MQLVQTHGPLNWVRIAQTLGSRTPKQCRERYHQNLKPTLNHDPITPEEGLQIERLVHEIGKRWAEIARRLHGRSDNAVKNWWNGSQNRRKRLDRRRAVHTGPYDDAYSTASSPSTMAPMNAQPTLNINSSQPRPQHGYTHAYDGQRVHHHHHHMQAPWAEAPLPSPCSSESAESDVGSNYTTSPARTSRTLQPIELPPLRTLPPRASGGEGQLPSLSTLASPAVEQARGGLADQRRLPPLGTQLPTAPSSPVQQLGQQSKSEVSPVDRDSRMNVAALLG